MQRSIAPELFTWPSDDPRLLGARCIDCGNVTFPVQTACPRCCGDRMEQMPLSKRGTLWTWTIQNFPPKTPPYKGEDAGDGFGVGYVELPGEVRVESRLTVNDPAALTIGMEMELCIVPLYRDGNGDEIMTYAFGPCA